MDFIYNKLRIVAPRIFCSLSENSNCTPVWTNQPREGNMIPTLLEITTESIKLKLLNVLALYKLRARTNSTLISTHTFFFSRRKKNVRKSIAYRVIRILRMWAHDVMLHKHVVRVNYLFFVIFYPPVFLASSTHYTRIFFFSFYPAPHYAGKFGSRIDK